MEISIQYPLISVLYVVCLVGFIINMIIVMANFMKWKSLRSLQTYDKILNCMAIFRALGFILVFLWNSILVFFPWLLETNIMISSFLYVEIMFLFYSSQWMATILCVFYCVRIVTYNYKLFIFLKTRISTMVPWLILASLLISLICSLPFIWLGYDLKSLNVSNVSIENMTEYEPDFAKNFNTRFLMYSVGIFPPFVIFCVAISLLIHFLLVHTRRMRSNESHIQSPNLTSHFGALKSMSLFLLLQIMFFICMSLLISGQLHHVMHLELIGWILLCDIALIHGLYMVSVSSEVKKMFTSMGLGLIRHP